MLTPEAAKERLKEWLIDRSDDATPKQLGAVTNLPDPLRQIGYRLLGRDAAGNEIEFNPFTAGTTAGEREESISVDALSDSERRQFFEALVPNLSGEIETTWQFLKNSPYQFGYARKSFRASQDPAVSYARRYQWLANIRDVAGALKDHALELRWLAAWSPHLSVRYDVGDIVGRLFAAVMSDGHPAADDVFDILTQSARNEHEIGAMGRHVTLALLSASRPDGWEFIEKMLLAAQRQEGLRQTILETVDEAHPEAFRRMLRLIMEHDLARFSSVVRALNVWLGLAWDSVSVRVVNDTLQKVLLFLEDDEARGKAIDAKDPSDVYLTLWATAFDDAVATVPFAERLLTHRKVEHRYVAAFHLANLHLPHAHAAIRRALDDEDLRVAFCVLPEFIDNWLNPGVSAVESFEQFERLYARTPEKPVTSKPVVWPWATSKLDREQVALCLFNGLGDLPPTRLIPYLPGLSPRYRAGVVEALTREKSWDRLTRDTLLKLVGDLSSDVRHAAITALNRSELQAGEPQTLERYLTRKTSDLRRGVIGLLAKQADALASTDRLLLAKDANQRLAGLELLRQLAEAKRDVQTCQARADVYRAGRKKLTQEEETQLTAIADAGREKITLENGLGLFDPADCTPVTPPQPRDVPFITDAAVACVKAIDDLIHEHRETPITVSLYSGPEEQLLGTVQYGFPSPDQKKSIEENRERLPLRELWEQWNRERPPETRDADGMELVRAKLWAQVDDSKFKQWKRWGAQSAEYHELLVKLVSGHEPTSRRYKSLISDILEWLIYLSPPTNTIDRSLDALENVFSSIPQAIVEETAKKADQSTSGDGDGESKDWRVESWSWRSNEPSSPIPVWVQSTAECFALPRLTPTAEQWSRYWRLLHWLDQPLPEAERRRPQIEVLLRARVAGAATQADLCDHIIGPRKTNRWGTGHCFDELSQLTRLDRGKENATYIRLVPELAEIADRCRDRIIAIEMSRGEEATPATRAALELASVPGVDVLGQLLSALGKQGFRIESYWNYDRRIGRAATLTHLVHRSYPRAEDKPSSFGALIGQRISAAAFTNEGTLQLTFLAPQWVRHIEAYLGWPGFTEGVYWFLAHMKQAGEATSQAAYRADASSAPADSDAASDRQQLSAWDRLIMQRTPLTEEERRDGAIDVAWFQRTYAQLTPKRWQAMAEAARFAATPQQAKHAQLVAEVLLGKTSRRELIKGIKAKKLKDYVRLLGLLPLAKGAKRDPDLGERYHILQEYRRYAKQLSAMTKDSAMRAVEIGMRNLALTAGYADPLRLEWAMEAESVKDLARGPVEALKDGVTVSLHLDERAQPVLGVRRGDKDLKSIPPAVKKDKKIAALAERVSDLKRQASRMRQSLETAMCRGDVFTGAELVQLCNHAVLAPLLERLVLVGDGIAGYPDKKGKALRDHRGKLEPVKKNELLRLAHPHDLLQTGKWDAWQHECFKAERVQPFKQVFRELYVVTKQEKVDRVLSRRYAGQQVNPQQAQALWGQRGWSTKDGVWKTFYDQRITASVGFNYGITTPLEVEGLTIESVTFNVRDALKPMKLTDVPPFIFSEVMRDMDLVVSVAHRGGVDPEATASTVEMRSQLLRETCQLLQLRNVRLKNAHALIDGKLGKYSVHLGSGTVHKLPGGSVCIVPVHAQHRGRLFLPFADDDPRTAEIVSKVLMLGRDDEIQDPIILDQLRRL